MDKNNRLIGIVVSVCGIIGFCLLIASTLLGDTFPNQLCVVAVICLTAHVIGLIVNLLYICKQKSR